ncbi:MAG: hypothetical protein AAF191_02560, partial [Verrucomicrobiota bacterium]
MKNTIALVLTIFFALSAGLQAEPVSVTLLLDGNKRRIGFVSNTNDKALLFQMTANPRDRGEGIPYAQIRGVSFTNEDDLMGPGRYAYSRERYDEAATAFSEVATKYEFLWGIGRDLLGNFACEARFFHIDSLRRLGRYEEIQAAMDTPTGKAMVNAVDDIHLPALKIFTLWRDYAAKDWGALEPGLNENVGSLSGKEKDLLGGERGATVWNG